MFHRSLAAALLAAAGAVALLAEAPPAIPADTLPKDLSLNDVPLGLGRRPVPKDNDLTAARVALGRRLFFDPMLSADGTVACVSCHRPDHGFASDGRPRGIRGQQLSRK